jgi:hypothetical protein
MVGKPFPCFISASWLPKDRRSLTNATNFLSVSRILDLYSSSSLNVVAVPKLFSVEMSFSSLKLIFSES